MSIAVNIVDQGSNPIPTRQFQPGQQIGVAGHITGLLGLGEAFNPYRVEIPEIFFVREGNASIFGNFEVRGIQLPTQPQALTVRVVATFSAIGQDVVTIPISVGAVAPGELPDPTPQGTWPGWVGPALAIGAVTALAFVVGPTLLTTRQISLRR